MRRPDGRAAVAELLAPGPTRVMGILNVTPDSFSDGGLYLDPDDAVAHAWRLKAQGADIIDVGGESTRPGAQRLTPEAELERIVPVVEAVAATGVAVSVDTINESTARAAWEHGASMINDISGGAGDEAMPAFIAESGLPFVVMHRRGDSAEMYDLAEYEDVVEEVRRELTGRIAALTTAGVRRDQMVVDPGLGFAKLPAHNWALLADWPALASHGLPVLIGASRKRFLGGVVPEGEPVSMRDLPTAVLSAWAAQRGAWGVRVHSVDTTRAALRVVDELQTAERNLAEGRA